MTLLTVRGRFATFNGGALWFFRLNMFGSSQCSLLR